MNGITGASGTNTLGVVNAAAQLTAGLVETGAVPDAAQGETFPTFAVALLKEVSANTNVDEWVACKLGQYDDNANQAAWSAWAKLSSTRTPPPRSR